jgi:predicted  nucleic acid-binding Zn-ribbon protein
MSQLEDLLIVQTHDTAADHLRRRRATLPERDALATAEAELRRLAPVVDDARERRDAVSREVKRLEDESAAIAARVVEVEKTLYSGSVSSPRELQAMQADVEQLQRHRDTVDEQELTALDQQEQLEQELGGLEQRVAAASETAGTARAALEALEAEIDGELAHEQAEREKAAAPISPDLLASYERARERARGVGVARLVGNTCQGCRLTIPATEVERIKRAGADGPVAHCDNCGAILVP